MKFPDHPALSPLASSHEGRIGLIDIGSNSVRLMVYDGLKRAPLPVFNEKVICGLARGLAHTGKLHPEGMKLAEEGIARFLTLARLMEVMELGILATAAVRDARDGHAFVERLTRRFKVDIETVSGEREAKLAAYGVLSSMHAPEGIVADFGGGSMELVHIKESIIARQNTTRLGALRLHDEAGGNRKELEKIIEKGLAEVAWLSPVKEQPYPALYAVGGSFRALAKMLMVQENYPLSIIHHYAVPSKLMAVFLKDLVSLKPEALAALPGVQAKRAELLLPAALVLKALLEHSGAQEVVFSSNGIREGYLFERLSPYMRGEDPLIASASDLAAQTGRLSAYARELYDWMGPLFPKETAEEKRLRMAVCLLAEIGARIQPDYRAEWVYYRAIDSVLFGLTHRERVTLALALFHRHQYKPKENLKGFHLSGERERAWARLAGTAANLAYHLCGGVEGGLPLMPLKSKRGALSLELSLPVQDIMGAAVKKRLSGLEESVKAMAKIAK